MSLRDKKILITAGPTLVPIDSVRVISNTATGGTGILLARKLQSLGAKVTLLLGGAEPCCLDKKIRLIRFRFFDELKRAMLKELKKKYNIVVHSAAVSDYRPLKSYGHKVGSGRKAWRLELVPTPKIINLIKRTDRSLFLVGFKFEPETRRKILIDKAKSLIRRADLDLAVANTVDRNRYRAYILNKDKIQDHARSKKHLVEKLAQSLSKSFNY